MLIAPTLCKPSAISWTAANAPLLWPPAVPIAHRLHEPASRHQGVEPFPRQGQDLGCELPERGKLAAADVAAVALGEAAGEQRPVAGRNSRRTRQPPDRPGAGAGDALLQHAAAQVGVDGGKDSCFGLTQGCSSPGVRAVGGVAVRTAVARAAC